MWCGGIAGKINPVTGCCVFHRRCKCVFVGGRAVGFQYIFPRNYKSSFKHNISYIPMERNVFSWFYFHSHLVECAGMFSVNVLFLFASRFVNVEQTRFVRKVQENI